MDFSRDVFKKHDAFQPDRTVVSSVIFDINRYLFISCHP